MTHALDNNLGTSRAHSADTELHSEPHSSVGEKQTERAAQSRVHHHTLLDSVPRSYADALRDGASPNPAERSISPATNRLGETNALRRSASGTSIGSNGIALPPSRHRTPATTLNPGTPGSADHSPGQHAPANHGSPLAQHGAAHPHNAHQTNHAGANHGNSYQDDYGQQEPGIGRRIIDRLPDMVSGMVDTALNYAQAAINIEKSMAAAVAEASKKV